MYAYSLTMYKKSLCKQSIFYKSLLFCGGVNVLEYIKSIYSDKT